MVPASYNAAAPLSAGIQRIGPSRWYLGGHSGPGARCTPPMCIRAGL